MTASSEFVKRVSGILRELKLLDYQRRILKNDLKSDQRENVSQNLRDESLGTVKTTVATVLSSSVEAEEAPPDSYELLDDYFVDCVVRGASIAQYQALEEFIKSRAGEWANAVNLFVLGAESDGARKLCERALNVVLDDAYALEPEKARASRSYATMLENQGVIEIVPSAFTWSKSNLQPSDVSTLLEDIMGEHASRNLNTIAGLLRDDVRALNCTNCESYLDDSYSRIFKLQSSVRHQAAHQKHFSGSVPVGIAQLSRSVILGLLVDLLISVAVATLDPGRRIESAKPLDQVVEVSYLVESPSQAKGKSWALYPWKKLGALKKSSRTMRAKRRGSDYAQMMAENRRSPMKKHIDIQIAIDKDHNIVEWIID